MKILSNEEYNELIEGNGMLDTILDFLRKWYKINNGCLSPLDSDDMIRNNKDFLIMEYLANLNITNNWNNKFENGYKISQKELYKCQHENLELKEIISNLQNETELKKHYFDNTLC